MTKNKNNSTLSQPAFPQVPFEDEYFNTHGTYIHPTAIVGPQVQLSDNVKIGPYCVLIGQITIGVNTQLSAHVTVGFPAQDVGTPKSLGRISIGADCTIREFVTIHASKKEDGMTVIGNKCYIMNFCHVGHDVILENEVILVNSVNLGGHTHVESGVMMMASSASHQFCRIGRLSAVTPFSATRQDLPPFCMFEGQPATFSGLNLIALKRLGLAREDINALKHVTKLFYQDKLLLTPIMKLAEDAADDWGGNEYVQAFLAFVKNSTRGVSKRSFSYRQREDKTRSTHNSTIG